MLHDMLASMAQFVGKTCLLPQNPAAEHISGVFVPRRCGHLVPNGRSQPAGGASGAAREPPTQQPVRWDTASRCRCLLLVKVGAANATCPCSLLLTCRFLWLLPSDKAWPTLCSHSVLCLLCSEKAPFTLCVEVLDEEEAAAAIEARAAAAAAASTAAEALRRAPSSSGGSGSYADSALSLGAGDASMPPQLSLQPFGEDAAAAAAAAAAEAAANGIQYLANHHRTVSMDTALLAEAASAASGHSGHSRDSSMDAAALAAVQGSSAVTGDAAAAATTSLLAEGSEVSDNSVHSGQGLSGEPSFAGMLAGGELGSPAVQRRLTNELDAVSDEPSSSSLRSSASPPCLASLATSPVQQQPDQQPPAAQLPRQAPQQLPPLVLPQSPKQVGAGTWIGRGSMSPVAAGKASRGLGSLSPIPATSPVAAPGGSKRRSSSQGRVSGSLDAALAGLRGEAPLVSVRLEVINDKPLSGSSARSSGSSPGDGQQQQQPQSSSIPGTPDSAAAAAAAAGVSSAERRRASLDAASRAPPHVCDRTSWACRLGLCKLCNTTLATVGDEEDAPWMQPRVRLHLTIQGGVGECADVCLFGG